MADGLGAALPDLNFPLGARVGTFRRLVWLRGPARVRGERVYLDGDGREAYAVPAGFDVVADFSTIREPRDILPFVRRHGLLTRGPEADSHDERVKFWLDEARAARTALQAYRLIRLAVRADGEAVSALDTLLREEVSEDTYRHLTSDPDGVFYAAGFLVTGSLTPRLELNRIAVVPEPAYDPSAAWDRFVLAPTSTSLHEEVFFRLALTIANRADLRLCECGRPFEPDDGRQIYCSRRCAERIKKRRWRARNPG